MRRTSLSSLRNAAFAGFLAATALAAPLAAQRGAIVGEVVDARSGRAVGRAVVQLDEYTRVVADTAGRFTVPRARPGSYTAVVSRLGYERHGEVWRVAAGDTLRVTVRMEAEPVALAELRVRATRAFDRRRDRALNAIAAPTRAFRREQLERSVSPTVGDFVRYHGRLHMVPCFEAASRTGMPGRADCVRRRGGGMQSPVLVIDGRLVAGGLAEAETFPLDEVARVEVINHRVVIVYTKAYVERALRRGLLPLDDTDR